MFLVSKDPHGWVDYTVDWSTWLNTSDTIASSAWTPEAGITVSTPSNTSSSATATFSGGEVGKTYSVTNRVTTSAGLVEDRTIIVVVEEH